MKFKANSWCFSGVCKIKQNSLINANGVTPKSDGVKIVMGPGTGLGLCFCCKSSFSSSYDVYPAEIGFNEWLP